MSILQGNFACVSMCLPHIVGKCQEHLPLVFNTEQYKLNRHVFQVGDSAQLNGISGILEGYRNVFSSPLHMSGPTVFNEVIQCAKAFATDSEVSENMLTVLLSGFGF